MPSPGLCCFHRSHENRNHSPSEPVKEAERRNTSPHNQTDQRSGYPTVPITVVEQRSKSPPSQTEDRDHGPSVPVKEAERRNTSSHNQTDQRSCYRSVPITVGEQRSKSPINQTEARDHGPSVPVKETERRNTPPHNQTDQRSYYGSEPVKEVNRRNRSPHNQTDERSYYGRVPVKEVKRRNSSPHSQTHERNYYTSVPVKDAEQYDRYLLHKTEGRDHDQSGRDKNYEKKYEFLVKGMSRRALEMYNIIKHRGSREEETLYVKKTRKVRPDALIKNLNQFQTVCRSSTVKDGISEMICNIQFMNPRGDTRMFVCRSGLRSEAKLEFVCLVVHMYMSEYGAACDYFISTYSHKQLAKKNPDVIDGGFASGSVRNYPYPDNPQQALNGWYYEARDNANSYVTPEESIQKDKLEAAFIHTLIEGNHVILRNEGLYITLE